MGLMPQHSEGRVFMGSILLMRRLRVKKLSCVPEAIPSMSSTATLNLGSVSLDPRRVTSGPHFFHDPIREQVEKHQHLPTTASPGGFGAEKSGALASVPPHLCEYKAPSLKLSPLPLSAGCALRQS